MKILAIGINHKTTAIEQREKFHLTPIEKELLLANFKADPKVMGAIVLSTCNRCEFYLTVVDDCAPQEVISSLFYVKRLSMQSQLMQMFYTLQDAAAAAHLMEVACGLDSLILGEKQILGQIKDAIAFSRDKGMMDKTLNILSNFVLETGKKARQETQIDFGGMSVSAAAVATVQEKLGALQDKSVLVLGSGKMGSLAINYLRQKKAKDVYLMNRTPANAEAVAQSACAGLVPFWRMKESLNSVDACICSTGAPHYIITKELVEEAVAGRQTPLLLIDISMPRNIDPAAASVSGVILVGLDELDKVIEQNLQTRQEAAVAVRDLVERKTTEFFNAMGKNAVMAHH